MNEVFNGVKHQSKYFRRKPKTIADVRAIDERVKHVNGVFSLENTESEYKKGALFASRACTKLYCCSENNEVLRGIFLFCG